MPTAKKISAPASSAEQPETPAAPPAPAPAEQPPVAPAPPEAAAAPAPAEQPAAPEPDPVFVTVRRTIGHAGRTWEPGDVVDVAVFAAIPGCDVERLIRKGALALEG